MVEDALAGKIDLIITKSVSRFARNTVDSLNDEIEAPEAGEEFAAPAHPGRELRGGGRAAVVHEGLSRAEGVPTLNDSTKKTAGFDLMTHYGTINTSSLTGSHTEKDDEETFKSEPKDRKTTLSINSEDGDITIQ